MEYNIRKALPSDIDEIIVLCAEHSEYEKASYSSEGKAEKLASFLFNDHPRIFCLLAESGKEILGFATYLFEFSTWDAAFYTHMDCLYLRPHARGFGMGEQLIKEIAKATKQNGCKQIQWQTPVFNERAIRFYHRIGATSKEKLRLYVDESTINKLIL